MAEAVAAIGVAAAAVQFFDFSLKTLTLCKQIHDSEKSATEANQELETSIGKLKQITENLQLNVVLPAVDRPIMIARQDCVAAIGDLEKLLDGVKPKSRKHSFATARSAFRAMRSKPKIEALQNRVSEAQGRFLAAASVDTRNDVARLLQEQGKTSDKILQALLPKLRTAHEASASSHAKSHKELLDINSSSTAAHKTTHSLLSEVQQDQKASLKEHKTMQATLSRNLAAIEAQADMQNALIRTTSKFKELLDSLYYPEMFERQQDIKPPSFGTFQWIFDSSPPVRHHTRGSPEFKLREDMRGMFARWLSSDEPLFWISGKAGSGKSSLMSLIQSDSKTAKALAAWANGLHVYPFSFYFWRPGTKLQKSIHGLLRSLLHQLVTAKPTIFDLVISTNPALHNGWTTTSLRAALRCSLPAFHEDRVFLMVDGLDEYEDQHDAGLLELLLDCQHMAHVKICLASRPETAILAKLKDYPSLRLQDLNAQDIETFVKGKLVPLGKLVTEELMRDIVKRADGVFLWAALVTKSMESGALAHDDTKVLQARLESTPVELDALFEHLLSNVDKVHYETLSLCLFHLDKGSRIRRSTLIGSIALLTATMSSSRGTDTGEGFLASCLETSERIVAQCKGLIEVYDHFQHTKRREHGHTDVPKFRARTLYGADADAAGTYYKTRILFVHRSAYDYLFSKTNQREGRHLQIVTMMDKGKLMHQTLSGLKSVLKLAPMVLGGYLAVHHFIAGISDAIRIAENAGIDLTPWLDDLHRHLPIWYSRTKPSMVNDRGDWEIENSFWYAIPTRFGYVISRWDTLMQSPHAQIFCSTLLRRQAGSHLSRTSEQWEDWLLLCRRLIAVLSEPSSGRGVVIATAHVRVDGGFGSETISWDARGHVNEATVKVFTDLLRITTDLAFLPDTPQVYLYAAALFALLRSCNVYLGHVRKLWNLGRGYLSPLQIQTDWACRRRPEQSDVFIRILCLAKNAATFEYQWNQDQNGELPGKQYGEDVVSLFDMRIESLETLQYADETIYSEFPRFQGTQEEFSNCLDQILSVVRADEQGQLDAWQQLYTLACLKMYSKDFWTIQTSETQWLAQITL
jgi:hypothetical protein